MSASTPRARFANSPATSLPPGTLVRAAPDPVAFGGGNDDGLHAPAAGTIAGPLGGPPAALDSALRERVKELLVSSQALCAKSAELRWRSEWACARLQGLPMYARTRSQPESPRPQAAGADDALTLTRARLRSDALA